VFDAVNLSHVYKYLILQASNFGGKALWIENNEWKNLSVRSYWQPTETSSRRSPVNPMMPMPETLYKRVEKLCSDLHCVVTGENDNIENHVSFPDDSIVYVDPPYFETTGYGNSFNILEWVRKVKNNCSVKIYVSEKKPLGDVSFLISEKRLKGNISGNNGKGVQEWLTEF